ncbi:MAG TPA: hypothetical protein PK691_11745, partial [Thermomicrobiales bacterium]|nr:hypothetical protein [Thermomicrobiales bacterium]
MTDHNQHDSVSALIQDACAQRTTRRDILRRGAALGMATTMIGAMITVNAAPAFAQDAETIVIGCPYNLT